MCSKMVLYYYWKTIPLPTKRFAERAAHTPSKCFVFTTVHVYKVKKHRGVNLSSPQVWVTAGK